MRTVPPADFNLSKFFTGVYFFQGWEVFPGHKANGGKLVGEHLKRLDVPDRLDGLRVLDIAPWNGFFGFECLRRGARQLVALGPEDPDITGFTQTTQLLEIGDKVHYVQGSVYDIKDLGLGKFDLVMFLGVIYHLRHPLLAMDLMHDHCEQNGIILVDSPLANQVGNVADGARRDALRPAWNAVQDIPIATFVRGGADLPIGRDPYNWFIPNQACVAAWVKSSGFEILHETTIDDWVSIKARKVDRPFAENLEGFNPGAPWRNRRDLAR